MFTSEHLTRLRESSAPHLRFAAMILAVFALILLISARFLSVYTADTNQRVQAVAALSPQTRVVLAGSSHVFATINPALLRWPSMNLAAPVCSYVCIEGIVRGNLPKLPGLEALIIEYDVVPAFYDTLHAYRGDYRQLLELDPDISSMQITRWQKYELWRDQLLERSWLGPLLRFGKPTPKEVLERWRGDRLVEDAVVGPGYANGPEVMPANDDGAARVARHLREAAGLSELARNEAALRRLIQLGLSRNLKLVLMRFPHHPSYWASLPEEWQASMDQLAARLTRDFPGGFHFWDFGTLPELSEADYRNGDHVNHGAVARVTAQLERRLVDLLDAELSQRLPAATPRAAHPPGH
jgi:hypothetical protein